MKCPGTGSNVLMSPEQGVFGYGSIDLLGGDEDDDIFNPWVHAPASSAVSVTSSHTSGYVHLPAILLPPVSDRIYFPSSSRFTFIKNIPSQSQHSRPRLRDIPPKTRSTPEATLVVDLVRILLCGNTWHTCTSLTSILLIREFVSSLSCLWVGSVVLLDNVQELLQSLTKHQKVYVLIQHHVTTAAPYSFS